MELTIKATEIQAEDTLLVNGIFMEVEQATTFTRPSDGERFVQVIGISSLSSRERPIFRADQAVQVLRD